MTTRRRNLIRLGLGLLVLVIIAGHSIGAWHLAMLERLEQFTYDARINLSLPENTTNDIVILDIDEASLAEQGQWPWGRDRLAELVDLLFEKHNIQLLGIDVVFAERDESTGLRALERALRERPELARELESLAPELDRDRRLARALADRPVVLGYYFETTHPDRSQPPVGALPAPLSLVLPPEVKPDTLPLPRPNRYGANLPLLQEHAAGGGFFDNPRLDNDGIYRRVPVMQNYEGEIYAGLSLAIIRTLLDNPPVTLVMPGEGGQRQLEALRLGPFEIPVDHRGNLLVPWYGPPGTFPYVSATDVLEQRVEPGKLEDAIVLLGTSAPGLLDLRATPVHHVFPGVEIHASLIAGILEQNLLHRPTYTAGAEFLMLLLIAGLMLFVIGRLPALWMMTGTAILGAAVVAVNFQAWQTLWVFPLATPLALLGSLFLLDSAWGYLVESRRKQAIKRIFGHYVPPELVEEMSEDSSQNFAMEGESREMTVLFSDVCGFTTLSEALPAREVRQLINGLLTPMSAIIHEHRGTIDKYIGDAIMAFWGAPLKDPQHAGHAVDAALAMVRALPGLNDEFRRHGWPEIDIGIGLSTGEMNVGNMGSEFRMAYTVMGDAVNVGARLEALTRQYHRPVLVSPATAEAATEHVFREVDRVRVKGREEPVTVFEPLGRRDELEAATLTALADYHQALRDYHAGDMTAAAETLRALLDSDPDNALCALYLERIRESDNTG